MLREARRSLLLLLAALPCTLEGQALVRGVVREDSAQRPVAGAEVSIASLARRTRTDSSGVYTFSNVPYGVHVVQARHVGYTPASIIVQVRDKTPGAADVLLTPVVTTLSAVNVTAPHEDMLGAPREFVERQRLGFGKFITGAAIRAAEQVHTSDLLMREGVILTPVLICAQECRPDPARMIVVNARGCPMRVFLDGALVYPGLESGRRVDWERVFDVNSVSVHTLAGVEVYSRSSQIPGEYGGTGAGCGVVVLWTRR